MNLWPIVRVLRETLSLYAGGLSDPHSGVLAHSVSQTSVQRLVSISEGY